MRSLLRPAALALTCLAAAYLTKSVLGLSDLVINRGLGLSMVALVAVHQLVPVVTQVLPFAVLIGTLAGLGHLRSTTELLSLETCGVSPRRMLRPALAFAAGAAVIGLLLSTWLAPASRRHLEATLRAVLLANPGAMLHAGAVHEFGEHRLTAREVSSRGDELRGVVLWTPDLGETLFAERAAVAPTAEGAIDLSLHQATALLSPVVGGGQVEVGSFHTILTVGDGGLDSEDTLLARAGFAELWRRSGADDPRRARLARAELHRRLALPLASLLFGLAAVPLVLASRTDSRTAGALLGLLLTVSYYGLTQLGNGLLRDPDVPVALAVWLPNGLGALGVAWLLAGRRMRGSVGAGAGRPLAARASGGTSFRVHRARQQILARYVTLLFVRMAVVCFLALFAGYLLVDVLERLQWFARYESTPMEALRFYGARAPLLMARVAPLSLLAAASLTVSSLDRRGELLAMQACGFSLVRALAPISAVALLAVPVHFVLTDTIVPRTNARADELKETEIKGDHASRDDSSRFIWYRVGGSLMQAMRMEGDRQTARDVTIYELDSRGFPTSRTDAAEARNLGDGQWELIDPKRISITEHGMSEGAAMPRLQLGGGAEELDTMHLDIRGLAREIRRAREDGYDTTGFEVDLQAKLAAPLACALLPLIVLVGAVAGRPVRSASRNLILASVFGIGFLLAGDLSLSLGYGARIPPAIAAWGPSGLVALACLWLVQRGPR